MKVVARPVIAANVDAVSKKTPAATTMPVTTSKSTAVSNAVTPELPKVKVDVDALSRQTGGDRRWSPIQLATTSTHQKARTEKPDSYPARVAVDDAHVSWHVPLPGYAPTDFTDAKVIAAIGVWADPVDVKQKKGGFSSLVGPISTDTRGRPQNPMGRTGVEGRGLLGKWGANPAGDPIVTKIDPKTGALSLLAIQRKDSGQWALPGGMVDAGESIFKTVARELEEETGVKLNFDDAAHVYSGYVDDRRNTDNAWMETTVKHKHISARDAAKLTPKGQDDAMDAQWLTLDKAAVDGLYASHGSFVKLALTQMLKDKSLPAATRAQLRGILVEDT